MRSTARCGRPLRLRPTASAAVARICGLTASGLPTAVSPHSPSILPAAHPSDPLSAPPSREDDSASDMDMSASDSDAPAAPAASSSRPKGSKAKSSQRVDRSDDEDAEGQPTEENPYPVEGIYTDEAERERCAHFSPPTWSSHPGLSPEFLFSVEQILMTSVLTSEPVHGPQGRHDARAGARGLYR